MNKTPENKTPDEIPINKTPHTPDPLKDPSIPTKNNPINPKEDEPESKIT